LDQFKYSNVHRWGVRKEKIRKKGKLKKNENEKGFSKGGKTL